MADAVYRSSEEMAARLNAEALAEMQKDRDEGKRHVRHLLADDDDLHFFGEMSNCPDCAAARKWAES